MITAVDQLKDELRKFTPEELTHQFSPSELAEIRYTLEDAKCAERISSFDVGPLYWLTRFTKTENPQYLMQGVPFRSPFPQRSYFVPLFREFMAKHSQLYVAKSRTMMSSWCAAGYAAWVAQYQREETLIQTLSQEKAEHVIDYVWQLWDNQEPWLKERHPLERRSLLTVAWKGGGEVAGIPAGAEKVRSFHSSTYILDEAAHVVEGEECVNAVVPSGAKIICISTARAGWFGDQVLL